MEHITKQIMALRSELTTDSQKDRLNKIQSWTQSEICRLRAQVEKLSKGKVDEIEVCEAISGVTRLTISSNRTTLKIARNIESEKVKSDLVFVAKQVKPLCDHNGFTMRGSIHFEDGKYVARMAGGGKSIRENFTL